MCVCSCVSPKSQDVCVCVCPLIKFDSVTYTKHNGATLTGTRLGMQDNGLCVNGAIQYMALKQYLRVRGAIRGVEIRTILGAETDRGP